MASGDTLAVFVPFDNEPPSSNFATLATRNLHPLLQFDATTSESAVFTSVMPQNYSNTTGVTVYVTATMTSATTNTLGWLLAFERMDTGLDTDADSFASNQTVTAVTVPGTSGAPLILSLAITKGANMDSVVAGDTFRLKVARDTANDTATGDAELMSVEIRET